MRLSDKADIVSLSNLDIGIYNYTYLYFSFIVKKYLEIDILHYRFVTLNFLLRKNL
jgi:hypothetical protein